jgi:hypothetical protein
MMKQSLLNRYKHICEYHTEHNFLTCTPLQYSFKFTESISIMQIEKGLVTVLTLHGLGSIQLQESLKIAHEWIGIF